MKLALYHNLPPGGALRIVANFVASLPEGVTCDVFTVDFGGANPFGVGSGAIPLGAGGATVPVRTRWHAAAVRQRPRALSLLRDLRAAERAVAAQINRNDYDAVVVHGCWLTQTPRIVGDIRAPTVCYMQEPRRRSFEVLYRGPLLGQAGGLLSAARALANAVLDYPFKRGDIQAVRAASQIMCNSCFTAENIQMLYGRIAHVAYLGVDESVFTLGPARDSNRERRILSVGGLERFKGHHLVVDAVGRIDPELRPEVHLIYERCDADYRKLVLRLASERGVELVEHRGIDDERLVELYRTSLATALVAQLEPFGLVALESSACGTPVVAFREGGYRETVTPGANGLLVERSVEALSEAIASICTGEQSFDARLVSSSVLPRWSWTTAMRLHLETIRRLAGIA